MYQDAASKPNVLLVLHLELAIHCHGHLYYNLITFFPAAGPSSFDLRYDEITDSQGGVGTALIPAVHFIIPPILLIKQLPDIYRMETPQLRANTA